uniref:Uncharacterized protein n=1 Tax=Coptotermes formosanus TaxID=36987 RepID=R4V4F0_COPFO|nr:hypothetical protein [Coptotermes formosanus]
MAGEKDEICDAPKVPLKCACNCCGMLSLLAAVSSAAVLFFWALGRELKTVRLLDILLFVFFVVMAFLTWPSKPDPCCYASCSDWCCDCERHACFANEGSCHVCLCPCSPGPVCGCCPISRSPSCFNAFLSVMLAVWAVVDFAVAMASGMAGLGLALNEDAALGKNPGAWAGQDIVVFEVLCGLFYAPLLFLFVLWNLAASADRYFAGLMSAVGGVKFAHRVRPANLFTDALSWGPSLLVQFVCCIGVALVAIFAGLPKDEWRNDWTGTWLDRGTAVK